MMQCTPIVTKVSKASAATIIRAEEYDESKQSWQRYTEREEQHCQHGRTNRSKANRDDNILNLKLAFSDSGPHRNIDNDQTLRRHIPENINFYSHRNEKEST
jgi:hypothetical protein